jgi:hypothetical protein
VKGESIGGRAVGDDEVFCPTSTPNLGRASTSVETRRVPWESTAQELVRESPPSTISNTGSSVDEPLPRNLAHISASELIVR